MTLSQKSFIFAAVAGSGLTAKAADKAGADYLLALNAGRFRVQGASSLTCFIPVRPANEWVFEFAEREILGRSSGPVFAGLSVSDPSLDLEKLVSKAAALGFSGVCNFPSSILIDGRLGARLEQEGLGFSRELELVRVATAAGLKSFVYVATNAQAREMVDAGATAICVNIGFTSGATGVSTHLSLDAAAHQIDRVLEGVPASIDKLCHGGPITSPEEALSITRRSRVQGFVAGSTLDRLPIEKALDHVTEGFKAIPHLTRIEHDPGDTNDDLVGSSLAMRKLRKDIGELAQENVPVLLVGETGTGKSLAARIFHDKGAARKRQPVIVDCLGLDHEHGNAVLLGTAGSTTRSGMPGGPGALEQSDGSTIVFEEISALTSEQQGQILRFADEKLVQRVGDIHTRKASARILSTTSEDLQSRLEEKSFRADLFYRICGHELLLPPLRDRPDDIPELAIHFGLQLYGGDELRFSNAALRTMLEYNWPGNVRELKNAVDRMIRTAGGTQIDWRAVEFLRNKINVPVEEPDTGSGETDVLTERDWIARALAKNQYRRGQTAAELGMTTRTLYNKIKKFDL